MSLFEPLKHLLGSRREEKIARALSLQALDGFQQVHATAPDLAGESLYERIMSARFGIEDATAHNLVEGARESYADWPIEREVKFCDVVHYFVAERCLEDQPPEQTQTHWIHGKIGQVVRDIIPEDL